jgi:protein-disulfide isomerase
MGAYMHKALRVSGLRTVTSTALLILSTTLFLPGAHAQQDCSCKGTDEQKIKEDLLRQLPQEIMKVLLQQNLLNHQIARGIDDYFKKQQQALATAREKQEQLATEKATHVRRVSGSRDHIYGNPDAPVSLIEYSDFECPFCKQFNSTPKEIVEAYGGKVNWVYRHFPLDKHNPGAQKEAEASECANFLGGNDAFWKYANSIYTRTQSNGNGFPLSQLVPLAKEIGLSKKQFKKCNQSGKFASRVREDIDEGSKIGISATPTSILVDSETGEVMLKSGALPSEAFKIDIEKMLGKNSTAKNSTLR